MKDKLNDYDCLIELFKQNGMNYREVESYNSQNQAFPCIWLDVGHIEFNRNYMISNIVTY